MKKTKSAPKYDFKKVERKWQKRWEQEKIFQPDMAKAKKPFYNLMMFPYPSAEGLHVGSAYTFSGVDTFGRFKKLQGYDVFEPIGLDGFGIHSENYAMKIGEHIKDVSARTEKTFYRQLRQLGNMHDWSRTVETYKPEYYKWTQWLFLQMFKKDLAYQKKARVNWCPSCKTVLSDEQVIQGQCERCDSFVENKDLKQWFFGITKYADRLLKNLSWIDWPSDVKLNQGNWIGKSEGANIFFEIKESPDYKLEVFTTRPDTLFGATYMVLAPEHELIQLVGEKIKNKKEVESYVKKAISRTEQERKSDEKEKTGVALEGISAVNPATGKAIPVWVADYVLAGYGTGAIMAVPAHDERDFAFAQKFGLEIKEVVKPEKKDETEECFSGEGVSVNSDFLDGLKTSEAKKEMTKWLSKNKLGKKSVDYKLRDWCVSRQRYWGPPIPIVWCKRCASKESSVIMVHGAQKYPQSEIGLVEPNIRHWHGWLKKALEKEGIKTANPLMPENWKPTYPGWKKEFEKNKVDENTVLIGHSLGAGFLVRWLGENKNVRVKGLVLVAPVKFVDIEKKKKIHKFLDFETNRSLSERVEKIVVVTSGSDSYDPGNKSAKHYTQELGAETLDLKGLGHFMKKDLGGNKFPQLFDLVTSFIEPAAVPVPEKDLPVKLPPMEDFLPEGKGRGPLAKNEKFVKTKCPACGAGAERETDVSDPFVDSAWYFLRYPSTEFSDKPFDKTRTRKWLPVDSYIGGKEHTVLHLLYSRFVTMVLKDLGYVDFEEPYKKFFGHGLITKEGAKMSKSKGNVVNPDDIIEKYGTDTMRLYLRFLGDFSQGGDWKDSGIEGMSKFIKRAWAAFHEASGEGKGLESTSMIDKTVKSVGEDLEKLSFNTAVARVMEFVNWMREESGNMNKKEAKKAKETLAFALAPMAPHIAEEMWEQMGNKSSIFGKKWPEYDKKNVIDQEIELVVQVNGKLRDKIKVSKDISEEDAKKVALESEKVQSHISDKEIKKVIYIPGRLVSIVV